VSTSHPLFLESPRGAVACATSSVIQPSRGSSCTSGSAAISGP
jgi:hypothetical protein